jgi:hypothetical protein
MKRVVLALLVGSALASPALARDVQKTCSGVLTDMRTIGVQLGHCDFNSLSENEFKRITDVCGMPGGIDKSAPACRVLAIVLPP